jgi:hypothetical protein
MDIALAAWSIVHGLAMLVIGGQLSQYATSDEAVVGLAQTVGDMLQTGLLRKS